MTDRLTDQTMKGEYNFAYMSDLNKRKTRGKEQVFLVADTELAVSVGRSVRRYEILLNCERFLHYRSCPTVRDWIAVYLASFACILLKPRGIDDR